MVQIDKKQATEVAALSEKAAALVNSIKAFNANRLPEMLRYKYAYMSENAFRFMRGTCHLFYESLSQFTLPPSPVTWICGDLHLENFGSYKGNNKLVYFDLNDFDEAILAPASWELVRLLTSILIAFDTLQISDRKAHRMAKLFLDSYSKNLQTGKPVYIEPQTATGIVATFLEKVAGRKQKRIIDKHTASARHKVRIDTRKSKYFELDKDLKKRLTGHIQGWLAHNSDGPYNYDVIDAAFRLAGTGSIGLRRYAVLLKSSNQAGKTYMLLDMKEAKESSLKPYTVIQQPTWGTEAERILDIQQRMQNVSPALLSTTVFEGRPYIIQEMQPVKDSINFKLIKNRYRDIYQVINDMGMLTAASQLRSSGRQGSAIADELILFGHEQGWQDTLIKLAYEQKILLQKQYEIYRIAFEMGAFEVRI